MRWCHNFVGVVCAFLVGAVVWDLVPASAWGAAGAEAQYQKARKCYYDLMGSETKKRWRSSWERCITLFDRVFKRYPDSDRGADALFTKGKL